MVQEDQKPLLGGPFRGDRSLQQRPDKGTQGPRHPQFDSHVPTKGPRRLSECSLSPLGI